MRQAGRDGSDFHRDRDGLRFHCQRQSGRSASAAGPFERRGCSPSSRRRREPVCWREADVDLVFSPGAAEAARDALRAGAPIFCDARMVAEGVTRARLPANNDVVCTLSDPTTPELAAKLGTTRTAAAIELWLPRLGGSVVAIGNAPTAVFRLLEVIAAGAPRPAAIIGIPVGFVGAAESKEALIESGFPAIIVRGRKGGSAMAAAAVNALASDIE